MSVVRLSERGEKALVFALFTLVVSFMFRDVFLGLVCVFFLGLMFFQYRRFSGTINDIESCHSADEIGGISFLVERIE